MAMKGPGRSGWSSGLWVAGLLMGLPMGLLAIAVWTAPVQASQAGLTSTAPARPIIDDLTLAREYAAYRDSLAGLKRYHVRYIRVATEAGARDLIAQLRIGANFETLAKRHSLHAESALAGGDLGHHAGCRWSKSTLALLDGLQPGRVSPHPVKGSHGWGVYRLESVTTIEPRSFDTYRRELLNGSFEPECPWTPPVTLAAPATAAPPLPEPARP